jgi:hypothetical protein
MSTRRVVLAPVAPAQVQATPLSAPLRAVPRPQATTAPAPNPNAVLDAKLLVISPNGLDEELAALEQALQHLGAPYDKLIATGSPPLTAGQLASGDHGTYSGVILTRGGLMPDGAGAVSAFSGDEWSILQSYEASFGVREASLYLLPDGAEGLGVATQQNTATTPLPVTCTEDGRELFFDVNCTAPITIQGVFAYPAPITGSGTEALLTDAAGNAVASIHKFPDGREALEMSFGQSRTAIHTLQLLYGVVSWANRGLFLGERHVFFGTQVDDMFITSDIFGSTATYRISANDMQSVFDWQTRRQQQPTTRALRFDFPLNASGTIPFDDLTAKAQAIGTGFKWISHTYTHQELDVTDYATTYQELERNNARVAQLGLMPYSPMNLVTPGITGLTNAAAMQAAFDIGVRYVVTDTSQPGYDNPTPNAGIYNPLMPQILMIPRRPTNLFYNVSQPAEWIAEYNSLYHTFWGRDLSYAEIVANEGDMLLRDLLKGENDPWMFHQANLRDNGQGHSLLSDLLDYALDHYGQLMTAPMISPTMDELGKRVADRMRYNASGATATIGPGNVITLHVTSAATVPVTGTCSSNSDSYAGQVIAHVDVAPGADVALPIATTCASTTGTGGTSGGTGGASGTGGTSGTGGAPEEMGTGGAPEEMGTGGAPEKMGTGGAPEEMGMGGAMMPPPPPGMGGRHGCSCDTEGDFGSPPKAALAVISLALASTLLIGRSRSPSRRRQKG